MIQRDSEIAVFDSGVGGLSVLRKLRKLLPSERFLYYGDSRNAPYGGKDRRTIQKLTLDAASALFARGVKALVIACNTATSAAINALREQYPNRIIVGIEPALKPAVDRFPGGRIAVMATPATLREEKFAALLSRYADQCSIIPLPCPDLVPFIEQGITDSAPLRQSLQVQLAPILETPVDAIVLGCTHFPFAERAIRAVCGESAVLLDGAEGTARETRRRLEQAGLLRADGEGAIRLENSRNTPKMQMLMRQLLENN